MKIYTKKGDLGDTRIYADTPIKVRKDSSELACYGTLDELNSHIGLLQAQLETPVSLLTDIQRHLFQIGFAISATTALSEQDVLALEHAIDQLSEQLEPQRSFILPGGCIQAAQAHVCRTVTRRAERELVSLLEDYPVPAVVPAYLNRLSDYFFVLARWMNIKANQPDICL